MVSRAMTFSDPTAHSSPLFYDLKILKLDDLHQLSISVFAYEYQNTIGPLYFIIFFTQTTNVHCYNTRSAAHGDFFILQKTALCTEYGLRSICFNGAKIWNSIPLEIRDASSVQTFKNNLKNLCFDSYISWYVHRVLELYLGWRRYFLAISALGGHMVGFSLALRFLLGNQENVREAIFPFLGLLEGSWGLG